MNDNGGRRSGQDRRQTSHGFFSQERRSGKDRRGGVDRRKERYKNMRDAERRSVFIV